MAKPKKVVPVKTEKPAKVVAVKAAPKRDIFTRDWIIENAIEIIDSESVKLTIRALHYRLVSRGMLNDIQHYKRVVAAMTQARWDHKLAFDAFDDHERETHGVTDIEVRRIALMEDQVTEWGLPPAPSKDSDSRSANWEGLGQVELDAVDTDKLQGLCTDAINDVFDEDLHEQLLSEETEERKEFKEILKRDFTSLLD